jgi:hypothetical protein
MIYEGDVLKTQISPTVTEPIQEACKAKVERSNYDYSKLRREEKIKESYSTV